MAGDCLLRLHIGIQSVRAAADSAISMGHAFGRTGGHFWSVNAEEQFYLLAPLVLVLLPSRHGRRVITWIVIALVAWVSRCYASIAFGVLAAVVASHYGISHSSDQSFSCSYDCLDIDRRLLQTRGLRSGGPGLRHLAGPASSRVAVSSTWAGNWLREFHTLFT